MRSPLTRLWSVIRGDKYMVDAYPAHPEGAAAADPASAEHDAADSPPLKER